MTVKYYIGKLVTNVHDDRHGVVTHLSDPDEDLYHVQWNDGTKEYHDAEDLKDYVNP